MWWVRSDAGQDRVTSSLEEALALSAHLDLRGYQVTCIGWDHKIMLDAVLAASLRTLITPGYSPLGDAPIDLGNLLMTRYMVAVLTLLAAVALLGFLSA
jgi:hypothetical protein